MMRATSAAASICGQPCIKNMKGSVPGLGPHVVGDGDMKVRVGLPPDEQEGNVGAPELDQTSRVGGDLIRQLVSHLRESGTGTRPLPEVVVDDRPEEIRVAGLLRLRETCLHL